MNKEKILTIIVSLIVVLCLLLISPFILNYVLGVFGIAKLKYLTGLIVIIAIKFLLGTPNIILKKD